jgi:Xaa-Pro aminopeptidase
VQLLALHEGGITIVDAELACERANTVKTQDEMTMYRAIGNQYRQTMATFGAAVKPGVTEEELAALVSNTWTDVGGEDVAQLNICSQENMNPWGRWPTKRVLQQGDFIGIDLHGRSFGGLRGDSSTTFFVGDNPPAEKRAQYQLARDYLEAAKKILRAGRPIADVMKDQPPVPDKYREQQFNYHIAHGAGIGSSGYPHLDPRSKPVDDTLRPNQVLAVEVFFAEQGQPWGVKFEEMILVGEAEPEVLVGIPLDQRML